MAQRRGEQRGLALATPAGKDGRPIPTWKAGRCSKSQALPDRKFQTKIFRFRLHALANLLLLLVFSALLVEMPHEFFELRLLIRRENRSNMVAALLSNLFVLRFDCILERAPL